MTALCGGGASEPVPGFGANVIMGGAAIGALLNNVPTPWAVAFATLVSGVTYDLSTMCATDPPALPTITGGDMVDLAAGPGSGPIYFAALTKFYDFVKYWAWFKFCRCAAVATPAPAAPPAAPAGLPQLNPPVAPPLPALNCGSLRSTKASSHSFIIPVPLPMAMIGSTGILPTDRPITMKLDAQVLADSTPSGTVQWTVQWFNSSTGLLRTDNAPAVAAGSSGTATLPQPATADQVNVTHVNGTTGATNTAISTVTIFCGGQLPTDGASGCCPPDPVATGLLTQILDLVTLMQRQSTPFAYVSGTAHAGLSSHGQLSVAGLIGMKVNFTALPARLGLAGDDPEILFDVGWLAIGDANGWYEKVRIRTSPLVWLPRQMSAATVLGYELEPGVTATVTELKREP